MAVIVEDPPKEPEVQDIETLVEVPKDGAINLEALFLDPHGLDPFLVAITEKIRGFKPDLSTGKGRDAIKALAFKVRKFKAAAQKLKLSITGELKKKPAVIDANWRSWEDRLESLATQARQPLDDWEAEEARKAEEARLQEEAKKLAAEIEFLHEVALLQNAEFDRKKAEDARLAAEAEATRLAEQTRLDNERIAREAQELADKSAMEAREAQEKAEREAREAQDREAQEVQRRKDAEAEAERLRVQQAEQEAQHQQELADAAARAEVAKKEAIEKAAQAERDRLDALEAEHKRQEDLRNADVDHRRSFNQEALLDVQAALQRAFGWTPEQTEPIGKAVLSAIVSKEVRHVAITY